MAQIREQRHVAADRAAVWRVLADLGAVTAWNPTVAAVRCEGPPAGVGAMRTCDLASSGTITEVVSTWDEGAELWFAIGHHGAIRSADLGYSLTDSDSDSDAGSRIGSGTDVTATVDYHLAFGPLGPVIDQLTVRRMMSRMLTTSLAGLKDYVESTHTEI